MNWDLGGSVMSNMKALEITKWAVDLANRYDVGVQGVIVSFISARRHLESDEAAKAFVEKETSELRRKLDDNGRND